MKYFHILKINLEKTIKNAHETSTVINIADYYKNNLYVLKFYLHIHFLF